MAGTDDELRQLRAEVERLRLMVEALRDRAAPPDDLTSPRGSDAAVDRRSFLSSVVGGVGLAVGAAAAAAIASAEPAAAATGDVMIVGATNTSSGELTTLANPSAHTLAVTTTWGTAIQASSTYSTAVSATTNGNPTTAMTVANTNGGWGVYAEAFGNAYYGDDGFVTSAGVTGRHHEDGVGVEGRSAKGDGVWGRAFVAGKAAVRAEGYSEASGLNVTAGPTTAPAATVALTNTAATGPALKAENAGWGVGADISSVLGVGVRAKGAKAAILLVPQGRVGPPTANNHRMGELLVDRNGNLWLCTVAGTPGTWRQIAFA